MARQLAFWSETLKDLPDQIELPTDRPRPAVSSHRGGHVPLRIDADLHRALLGLSRDSQASLFMVLQAGLAALLTRLGAGNDIPIGSPIAGRTDAALDDLVGFFINTLVLRTDTSGNPSLRDLIGRVRANNLAAYSHQDLPFERLVEVLNPERSLSRHPLFQVFLVLQNNAPTDFALSGLTVRPEDFNVASARFDLAFALGESRSADGLPAGIDGILQYATDLFDRGTVEALAQRLVRAVDGRGCQPRTADRQARHSVACGTPHHCARVERHGASHSVRNLARTVRRAGGANSRRRGGGVRGCDADLCAARRPRQSTGASSASSRRRPEVVVGLCVERSLEMMVALLGILKAGGAYLPLDPAYPPERLAFMLEDAAAPVLLTQSALLRTAARTCGQNRMLGRRLALDRPTSHHGPSPIACTPPTPPTSSTPQDRPARPRAFAFRIRASSTSRATNRTFPGRRTTPRFKFRHSRSMLRSLKSGERCSAARSW